MLPRLLLTQKPINWICKKLLNNSAGYYGKFQQINSIPLPKFYEPSLEHAQIFY